ncbi:MAG: nucleotide exchange factor GrpE [Dehalococcoidia bacterium]|nr:nucleotide exchange factor GrpE [Dehalococcoidia bacterium]
MTEDRQPEIQDIADQIEEDTEDSSDLEERLEEAERERDQFRTLALRYKADLENYKKRAASELDETRERANAQLLLKLIGLSDDFNRALDYIPEDTSGDGWVEGLRLTQRSMENVMQTEGLSRIEAAIGQPFDVYEHEAVFFEPTNEVDEGTVVRVVRNGYKLRNRVLRAAQVSVAQAIQPQENTETEIQDQEAR